MDEKASITASTAVLPRSDNLGIATITWDTGSKDGGQVYVSRNEEPEKLFAGGSSGTREVSWIAAGSRYVFRLYLGKEHADLLAEVEVIGEADSADPADWYPRRLGLRRANASTIEFLTTTNARVIAEVGVYHGHTSVEIARHLNGDGFLYLFDFEDNVETAVRAVNDAGFINVIGYGNSRKTLDSYNWSLMRLVRENPEPIYDFVFLDGAHTWGVDALAFFLLDRLLKPGGFIDFDDYEWVMQYSPALNPTVFPQTVELYTEEQIATKQVALVVDLLVKRDPRYREVITNKVYQKID